ncbi:MAG: TrkH family potassium uptake protein, partial [Armatimonadota bacterium]
LQPAAATFLSFLILIIIGTILLMLPISWVDGRPNSIAALFTATSAVCVTGLVVVDTGSAFTTFGQVIIMFLIQMGGIGYMTMATAVAILLGRKLGISQRLLLIESHGKPKLAGVLRLARNTLLFALLVEFVAAIILSIRFAYDPNIEGAKAIYFGVFHAVSGFCNAGFDLFGPIYGEFSSLSHYKNDITINLTLSLIILIGTLGFPVIDEILHREKKRFSLHTKMVFTATAAILFAGTILILIIEWSNPYTIGRDRIGEKLLASFFQSASRTAGFSTIDIAQVHAATLLILGIMMFIGGSPGSVAGGIKTTTFIIIIMSVISVVKGKTDTEIFGRRILQENVSRALAIIILALVITVSATIFLTLTEVKQTGVKELAEFMSIDFEVLSAWGTVGYSTGITRDISTQGNILLIILMFIGRLGSLTVFAALVNREKPISRRLSEEDVILG